MKYDLDCKCRRLKLSSLKIRMIKVWCLETVPQPCLSVSGSPSSVCKSPSRLALKVCFMTPASSSASQGQVVLIDTWIISMVWPSEKSSVWAVKYIDAALFSVPLSFIKRWTIPFSWKALLWSYWAGFMTAIWIKLLTLINGGTFSVRSDQML